MLRPAFIDQIDRTTEAEDTYILQCSTGRFGQVDIIAAGASPPDSECSFGLETMHCHTQLVHAAAEASSEIDRTACKLRVAELEAQVFIGEHRQTREPPCGTFLTLGIVVLLAMVLEAAATAPIYSPSVGWPSAIVLAILICVGMLGPAVMVGLSSAAARHEYNPGVSRHRHRRRARRFGDHDRGASGRCAFRELVATKPTLILHPIEAMFAIVRSIQAHWFPPLMDPPNWGLFAAGALAGAFGAYKTFITFGYIGWRPIGLRKRELRDKIVDLAHDVQETGRAAKKAAERDVGRKTKDFRRNRRTLVRARALNDAVVRSGRTALAIGAKVRRDVIATAVEAIRSVSSCAARDIADQPMIGNRQLDDRAAFAMRVDAAISRQDAAVAKEAAALAELSDDFCAFVAALKWATDRALDGSKHDSDRGLSLTGPEE